MPRVAGFPNLRPDSTAKRHGGGGRSGGGRSGGGTRRRRDAAADDAAADDAAAGWRGGEWRGGENTTISEIRGTSFSMQSLNRGVTIIRRADATLKTRRGATALSLAALDSSSAPSERRQVVELLKAHLADKK
jgi:hypothetical protein